MDVIINILAVIGALCLFCTVVLLLMLGFDVIEVSDEDDEIIRLINENKSLKEQLEKRNLISIAQGIEIEMLTTERKALNQEVINQMLEDYDHENLIAMNT